ncbi:MAG: hypothetical protein JST00_09700 [Deltaproteobacteria bacterium]|nr:hypothetical protein [Deltaproteobacteria bacterium]
MAANSYRDAQVGIRARLADLEARIREREAEVTTAFWENLDDELRERMLSEREAVELVHARATFEELARAEQLLAAYLDELERLIAALPAMEEEWHELPDEVADPPARRDPWPLGLPTREEWLTMERRFLATVRERDRNATVVKDGARTCIARFRDKDCPFALRATAYSDTSGQVDEVGMCLVTSVPRAMPRLLVRHETLVLSVGKALGLKHELEVGEPSFDGLFLIEGSPEAVTRLLVPAVRAQLLVLSRFDVPTLEIDPPHRVASIRWRFEPQPKALDAAVRVLAAIRETTPDVRFRSEAAE